MEVRSLSTICTRTFHPQRLDLVKILVAAIEDMQEYCSTGYIARLVNVLVGFDVSKDGRYTLTISNLDEVCNKISRRIEIKIKGDDHLSDLMVEQGEEYLKFLESEVNIVLEEWNLEKFDYKIDNVIKFLVKFTGVEGRWTVKDDKVCL